MTNDFEIEKHVPIPGTYRGPCPARSTMRKLAVGDSFLLPLNGRSVNAIRVSIYGFAKADSIKVATRVQEDGLRIWRVE